eukprot:4229831-Pleurochrysis_carterae.AAC.1
MCVCVRESRLHDHLLDRGLAGGGLDLAREGHLIGGEVGVRAARRRVARARARRRALRRAACARARPLWREGALVLLARRRA